jgi:hypothetical protein
MFNLAGPLFTGFQHIDKQTVNGLNKDNIKSCDKLSAVVFHPLIE